MGSSILTQIANAISPVASIATKWQFWAWVGGIIFVAIVMFLMVPALQAALLWAGKIVGIFFGG